MVVFLKVFDLPLVPAPIASISSFLRGDSCVLVTRLRLPVVPCDEVALLLACGKSTTRFPSAFERTGRSELWESPSGSPLSESEPRGPKRSETWILSSLSVRMGDRSHMPNLPESKTLELDGRVVMRACGATGVSSK